MTVRSPSLEEVKKVLNLRHMMHCVEHNILSVTPKTRFTSKLRSSRGLLLDNVFDFGFFRSMYRSVIIGAIPARPYIEPFFAPPPENSSESEIAAHQDFLRQDWEAPEGIVDWALSPEIVEHLRKYPTYKFDLDEHSGEGVVRERAYEEMFGDLVTWLVGDAREKRVIGASEID